MDQPRDADKGALAKERLTAFVDRLALTGVGDASNVLEPAAATLFSAFEEAGVEALLLKGAALASLLYQGEERRRYSDLDVLPAPHHLAKASEVLTELGYRSGEHQLGLDDVGRVVHGGTWLSSSGTTPHEIDLHSWIPGARVAPEAAWPLLWARATTIDVRGQPVHVLDRTGQALQLAMHAAQHGPRYVKGLAELRLALDRWPIPVWREAVDLAAELDALELFSAGLRLVTTGVELADALHLPHDTAVQWEVLHLEDRPRGTFHVQALRDAPSLAERIHLVRRALFPNRRWLSVEYPWVYRGGLFAAFGYALHLARTPLWAMRAWKFRRKAMRAAEPPSSQS